MSHNQHTGHIIRKKHLQEKMLDNLHLIARRSLESQPERVFEPTWVTLEIIFDSQTCPLIPFFLPNHLGAHALQMLDVQLCLFLAAAGENTRCFFGEKQLDSGGPFGCELMQSRIERHYQGRPRVQATRDVIVIGSSTRIK